MLSNLSWFCPPFKTLSRYSQRYGRNSYFPRKTSHKFYLFRESHGVPEKIQHPSYLKCHPCLPPTIYSSTLYCFNGTPLFQAPVRPFSSVASIYWQLFFLFSGCLLDSAPGHRPPDVPPRNPTMSRLNGRLASAPPLDNQEFEPSCLVRTPSGTVYIPPGTLGKSYGSYGKLGVE